MALPWVLCFCLCFVAARVERLLMESKYGITGRVVCVDIDPESFSSWCKSEGRRLDADARSEYASMVAYRTITDGQ